VEGAVEVQIWKKGMGAYSRKITADQNCWRHLISRGQRSSSAQGS